MSGLLEPLQWQFLMQFTAGFGVFCSGFWLVVFMFFRHLRTTY